MAKHFILLRKLKLRTGILYVFLFHDSGKFETVENRDYVYVDVRDVAEALLLVFEKLEALGRYICGAHNFRFRNVF